MRDVTILSGVALACGLLVAPASQAEGISFQFSGFGQFTVGKVLSGDTKNLTLPSGRPRACPCAIANWEYVGVYEKSKGWQADQESLIGLQGTVRFGDSFSATAQVLSRPNNKSYRPTLDWGYASWNVNDNWTLQAGRKRIPLYYYSDFLYIGNAYPWVRPPQDVYGWPIYAYDGVNAAYTGQWGSFTVDANLWTGGFTHKNAPYNTELYWGDHTHEKWSNMVGGYITLTRGDWNGRVMVMRQKDTIWSEAPGQPRVTWTPGYPTTIVALSLNYDGSHWLVRSELNRFKQSTSQFQYDYYLLGVGYKMGDWTPMVTMSNYKTKDLGSGIEGRTTRNVSLRYDLNKNWALKAQYDISKDKTTWYDFFGDHKLLTLSAQASF
ncbi:porin [Inhella gelatinilytica]|uniref:Porin n=1 Tax=Inhella gelatinilytica TaxID=2795030 RepID=A0A931NDQ3_9BURK|nr:porin [Inhella gelatinilytica]MBH9551676.1 porin [Inhella gelatinilytica]